MSAYEIERVLNALEFIIQEKLGDENSHVEITVFPGLKIYSKVIPASNRGIYQQSDKKVENWTRISAKFTKAFKYKLHNSHRVD